MGGYHLINFHPGSTKEGLLCIPLRGKSVCILFISPKTLVFFWLNVDTLIKRSVEIFFTPLFLNLKHLRIRSSRLLCYTYYLLFANILKWHQLETYIDDTQHDVMKMVLWLFLELLTKCVQLLSRNGNI